MAVPVLTFGQRRDKMF